MAASLRSAPPPRHSMRQSAPVNRGIGGEHARGRHSLLHGRSRRGWPFSAAITRGRGAQGDARLADRLVHGLAQRALRHRRRAGRPARRGELAWRRRARAGRLRRALLRFRAWRLSSAARSAAASAAMRLRRRLPSARTSPALMPSLRASARSASISSWRQGLLLARARGLRRRRRPRRGIRCRR